MLRLVEVVIIITHVVIIICKMIKISNEERIARVKKTELIIFNEKKLVDCTNATLH